MGVVAQGHWHRLPDYKCLWGLQHRVCSFPPPKSDVGHPHPLFSLQPSSASPPQNCSMLPSMKPLSPSLDPSTWIYRVPSCYFLYPWYVFRCAICTFRLRVPQNFCLPQDPAPGPWAPSQGAQGRVIDCMGRVGRHLGSNSSSLSYLLCGIGQAANRNLVVSIWWKMNESNHSPLTEPQWPPLTYGSMKCRLLSVPVSDCAIWSHLPFISPPTLRSPGLWFCRTTPQK